MINDCCRFVVGNLLQSIFTMDEEGDNVASGGNSPPSETMQCYDLD